MAKTKKKRFLILDGNSLLHRAWHAIPPLTTKDGRVVNAAYGFTNVVEKMLGDLAPDYFAVARRTKRTKRHVRKRRMNSTPRSR
jgi:DNA polymerase-1